MYWLFTYIPIYSYLNLEDKATFYFSQIKKKKKNLKKTEKYLHFMFLVSYILTNF